MDQNLELSLNGRKKCFVFNLSVEIIIILKSGKNGNMDKILVSKRVKIINP
jgi:hypothetical protein